MVICLIGGGRQSKTLKIAAKMFNDCKVLKNKLLCVWLEVDGKQKHEKLWQKRTLYNHVIEGNNYG